MFIRKDRYLSRQDLKESTSLGDQGLMEKLHLAGQAGLSGKAREHGLCPHPAQEGIRSPLPGLSSRPLLLDKGFVGVRQVDFCHGLRTLVLSGWGLPWRRAQRTPLGCRGTAEITRKAGRSGEDLVVRHSARTLLTRFPASHTHMHTRTHAHTNR